MKVVHTIWRPAAAALVLAGVIGTVAFAARQSPTALRKASTHADGPAPTTAAMSAVNLNTGFEATDAPAYATLGYIAHVDGFFPAGCGSVAAPCWGHTTGTGFSLITPTIDTAHPFAGTQHLRVSPDPSTRTNQANFGLGVDARYPRTAFLSVGPAVPNTVSLEFAVSNSFGQDFRVQPQSNSQGFLATSALFHYAGGLYILDDVCGTVALGFMPTGVFWDTTGGYQNYTVVMDPCANTINYYYGGVLVYTGCVYAGSNLEQFLLYGDNYPGSTADVDNLVMETAVLPGDVCPSVCGDGQLNGAETCDTGIPCGPGHTCDPVTCQCDRVCTLAAPCTLVNGLNGPFAGPFDAAYGGIFLYASGAAVASVDLCGSTGWDTRIYFWGSAGDGVCDISGVPCGAGCPVGETCLYDPGNANDDCCDELDLGLCGSYGVGADPSASCYNNLTAAYESCTCYDIPAVYDPTYLLQTNTPGTGDLMYITVNKKAACGGPHVGACCDTNGAGQGCTDNVFASDCTGADKVWTENGKCATVTCACIPICNPPACGDDGCGGSCGTCDDSNVCTDDACVAGVCVFTNNTLPCNDGNFCTINDTCGGGTCSVTNPNLCSDGVDCTDDSCNEATDSCGHVANNTLCDDGLWCNGAETCSLTLGCQPGIPECTGPGQVCYEDKDACFDNIIPTVSEWGIVILTLLLLTGAKVYFSRRQATA